MRALPILTAGAMALVLAAPAMAAPDGKRAGYDRSAPVARADMMTKVDARFAKIDTNGDGTIDAAEMAAYRDAMRTVRAERIAAMTEEERAKMQERRAGMKERWAKRGWLARVDANGDGLISREEFAAPAMKRFERMDADGDGIVTPDERKAARRSARG